MRRVMLAAVPTGGGLHDLAGDWRNADGGVVRLVGSAVAMRASQGRVIGLRGAVRPQSHVILAAEAQETPHRQVQALVEGNGPQVALQPIYHLQTGELAGFEALARFACRDTGELF